MAFFSASVTPQGRPRLATQAGDESISPGVRAGSGTVQDPLDLSTSALRQCCADAKLVRMKKLRSKVSRLIEDLRFSFLQETWPFRNSDFTPWRSIPHESTIVSE